MRILCAIVLLSLVFKASPLRANTPSASPGELLRKFEAAVKAHDTNAVLSLFDWSESTDEMRGWYKEMITEILEQDIKGLKLSSVPINVPATVRASFKLVPLGVIEISFLDPDVRLPNPMPLPYGEKGRAFFFAPAVEEESPPEKIGTNKAVTVGVCDMTGKPLANIPVVCATANEVPFMMFKKLFGGLRRLRSDAKGRVMVALDHPDLYLIASTQECFGWLRHAELVKGKQLLMEPWGRIEGTRTNRNFPVVGEHLSLSLDRDFYGDGSLGSAQWPFNNMNREVLTDKCGHFTFKNVPPLHLFIERQERQRGYWGYFWSVDVKPGRVTKLEINTRGRTVKGIVKKDPRVDGSVEMASCSCTLFSSLPDRTGSRNTVGFPISSNGSFTADHVEPGDYKLSGDIRQNGKMVALLDSLSVHIPQDNSSAEDLVFDAGTVVLKPAVNFAKGDLAPDFSCVTLEGKPLKLSMFRGKYVLLDFWATWCGPCVAEMPNLKAVYDAYKKDERFVMISLSVDEHKSAPIAFARNQGITWIQGFLNGWSKDLDRYGVYAIPAVFLIGPDGKFLATGLRHEKIKHAVSSVLDTAF